MHDLCQDHTTVPTVKLSLVLKFQKPQEKQYDVLVHSLLKFETFFSGKGGGGEIEIKEGGKLCDVMHINPLQCLRSLFAYLLFQITSALSFSAECCYSFMQITEEQIHLYHLCILLRFLALSLLIENKKIKPACICAL
jgi:hypothetical protein